MKDSKVKNLAVGKEDGQCFQLRACGVGGRIQVALYISTLNACMRRQASSTVPEPRRQIYFAHPVHGMWEIVELMRN